MNYQNYEDYMRAVLGYANNEPNYTYDDYYPRMEQPRYNELNELYPDIYRIVNPVIEDVCNRNRNQNITDELVKKMTDEVYTSVEGNSTLQANSVIKTELKNGDVRNPNARKTETRQRNFLLNDLIRILILKNLLRPRPPVRPPFPGPSPRPPYPGPRPPYPGPGPRTPVM